MSDKDANKEPTVDYASLAKELEAKVNKYEVDLAYKNREIEKLSEVKKQHDQNLNNQVNKGDPDAIEALKKKFQNDLAELDETWKGKYTKIESEFKKVAVSKEVLTKAAEYFNTDSLELIESKINQFCDYEDGKIVVRNEKGEIRYSNENKREPMGYDEYLKELTQKYKSCAKSNYVPATKDGGQKSSSGKNENGLYSAEELIRMTEDQRKKAYASNPENARIFLNSIRH